ncbi:hypothetical protein [Sphingobacterium lactis]|uniref:hypothetical protein n=1 Tax=Sphingobacterium lactis TaxID=797291 RepID=UPI003DA2DCFB
MKYIKFKFAILLFSLFVLISCEKGHLPSESKFNLVELTLQGSTSKVLEILYMDKVIDTTIGVNLSQKILLNLTQENNKISFREKGSSKILKTISVDLSPFIQSASIIYDGKNIYDQVIKYIIKGYAMEGELEFILDGETIFKGMEKIESTIPIALNKNQSRKLEIKKTGGSEILFTKEITTGETDQFLKFLFDGSALIDKIQLDPPKNPKNMGISFQFKTIFADYQNRIQFVGGNEVDFVVYSRRIGSEEAEKLVPEVRISVPMNNQFKYMELPPLKNPEEYEYTFDIYKKGTSEIAYIRGGGAHALIPTIDKNGGTKGDGLRFKEGTTIPLILTDEASVSLYPPRTYIPKVLITNLSAYFN